jgi:alkylation response protein AidB-like acyl-CoA dehydrogenase
VNFLLSEEQQMVGDVVDRVVQEQYAFDARRAALSSDVGWPRDLWLQLGELGILGAPLADASGGTDESAIVSMLVMQSFGRGLVTVPYVPTIVCAGALIARLGSEAQQREHLPEITLGKRVFAFACAEHQDGNALTNMRTTAVRRGDSYCINGCKTLVVGAPWADWLIVVTRYAEVAGEEAQFGAFIIPANCKGITTTTLRTVDGGAASEMQFENVIVDTGSMVGAAEATRAVIEKILDEATVALCAQACGAISALLTSTVEYAKSRKQFGRPIGSFQVLQHKMVDMLIAREQAASIVHHASLCLDADAHTRQRAVSACKVRISQLGTRTAQAAVQIHGGIGITEDVAVSHYFRLIEVINMQFGDVDAHLRRYGTLLDS